MSVVRDAILKEQTKKQTFMLTTYLRIRQEHFDDLMLVFLENEPLVAERAALYVGRIGELRTLFIMKHLEPLILNLQNDVHVAVKRNTLRALQYVDIPEDLQGIAAEICFGLLNEKKEPVAVKVFAMTVLANICKRQPELANELQLSIETQSPFASAAFLSRAKKVLKKLKKINKYS